ncbi:DUF222 domain-containing protein [Kribbella sp. NPDC055110]
MVPGFGAKANITVTIDLQDLKAMTADAIGQTVYGNGLSAATIRRLACDAKVIPIVLGSNSEPLDVGRAERLVTRAMRRALNTRDRGCVVCGAPPILCDAHHLISWIDGGDTKINNLVLICRRHHRDLHHGHWTITITNGQVHVATPAWADPPPRRRHTPPDNTPPAHQPPGEHPTPPAPPDTASRAHQPRGEHPTRPAPADGGLTRAASSRAQTSTPAADPWDETPAPAPQPPDTASRAHQPPGEHPTPPAPGDGGPTRAGSSRPKTSIPAVDPWDEAVGPAPEPPDGGLTCAGSSRPEASAPAVDPWGETDVPAAEPPELAQSASAPDVKPSRWHCDESTRAEAARFAVWGEGATNDSGTGPPSFATI